METVKEPMESFFIAVFIFLASCGYPPPQQPLPPAAGQVSGGAYTFANFQQACFSCHNASAPKIPTDEAGFKASAKVKKTIENGSMPPNPAGFDKAAALKFFQ